MREIIFPEKLKKGDLVRVIAPSRSISIVSSGVRDIAEERMRSLGLEVSFGKHVLEKDEYGSSSMAARLEDLHDAFQDPRVKGIFSVIGGYNSNQLLPYIDWKLIRAHPKPLFGYSDTTALQNAILAKSGVVSYSSPAFATFGQKLHFEYTLEYFKHCIFEETPYGVTPSPYWSDDRWYENQEDRNLHKNKGYEALSYGEAEGIIVGGNLCTLQLLFGTAYLPSLKDVILFIEDDSESSVETFTRDFMSLLQQKDAENICGIVLGRFQKASKMSSDHLLYLVTIHPQLKEIPIISNADFGHTDQQFTFPIGGSAHITSAAHGSSIEIIRH